MNDTGDPLNAVFLTGAKSERRCPVCGALVRIRIVYGTVMLDYHMDARKFKTWCRGSDMTLEAEP